MAVGSWSGEAAPAGWAPREASVVTRGCGGHPCRHRRDRPSPRGHLPPAVSGDGDNLRGWGAQPRGGRPAGAPRTLAGYSGYENYRHCVAERHPPFPCSSAPNSAACLAGLRRTLRRIPSLSAVGCRGPGGPDGRRDSDHLPDDRRRRHCFPVGGRWGRVDLCRDRRKARGRSGCHMTFDRPDCRHQGDPVAAAAARARARSSPVVGFSTVF